MEFRKESNTDLYEEEELKLKEIEEEFNITGVNNYKQQLENNIVILNNKVKEMQRRCHYAEIQEKRIN